MHMYSQPATYAFTDLPETFLSSPNRCVDDLEEELSSTRVENKDSSVDGLCGKVTLKRLQKNPKMFTKGTTQETWAIPQHGLSPNMGPICLTLAISPGDPHLVNGDSVHIGIIDKPDDLV